MLGPLLALTLGATSVIAAGPVGGEGHAGGSFEDGGDTKVSAMMMFVGNENKVYILDKSEGNPTQINGHPAMGSLYDIASRTTEPVEIFTNPFCASGMHMPNGSFITFGGNQAVGPGGDPGDVDNGAFDTVYGSYAGNQAVRVLNPQTCTGTDAATNSDCQWYDNSTFLHLQVKRWYAGTEPLGDGTVTVVGGFTSGGYINRNYPDNSDPVYQGGGSSPTYEFWPPRAEQPVLMQFLVEAGGLNSYPLMFLMASGKVLLQANVSTILWDPDNGDDTETPLPPMPENIVRVYPASGANAMMPLRPDNNYEQTILFCGGSDMPDEFWGNYSWPFTDTWNYPASAKCHHLTPEPQDGSPVAYVEDDPMPTGRSMGQFILLPNGQMVVLNGAYNGTAGFSQRTLTTPEFSQMPFGESLASGPVGQPAIYNPTASPGQRWSTEGLDSSDIPRLYHSSALLLPDASILIAGSNPNYDVNMSTAFPTTYKAERWYPPYFSAPVRPVPSGIPSTISYGGAPFDITIPASSYSGSANEAAGNSSVWLMRQGFTTHAMNMGQRALQLNSTYTVNKDGSFVLHTSQAPPNPNLFQPGPAFVYVSVHDIPSNGTYVIVGNGQIGTQPTTPVAPLPPSVQLDGVVGTGPSSANGTGSPSNGSDNGGQSGSPGGTNTQDSGALPTCASSFVASVVALFTVAAIVL